MKRRLTPRSARHFRRTVRDGALVAATAYAVVGTANHKPGFFTHSPSIGVTTSKPLPSWSILLPMMDTHRGLVLPRDFTCGYPESVRLLAAVRLAVDPSDLSVYGQWLRKQTVQADTGKLAPKEGNTRLAA